MTEEKAKFDLREVTQFQIEYKYEPAVFDFNGDVDITAFVENAHEALATLDVSDKDNYKWAAGTRASINKKIADVKSDRLRIEKELTADFKPYKAMAMEYEKGMKSIADTIGDKIKSEDDFKKEKRRVALVAYMAGEATKYGVDHEDVPFNEKWLNVGNFNFGTRPKPALAKEIDDEMRKLELLKQQHEREAMQIETRASEKGLEAHGYVALVGRMAAIDILARIDKDAYDKEVQAQVEAEKRKQVADKVIDEETGEVIERDVQLEPVAPVVSPEPVITSPGAATYQYQFENLTVPQKEWLDAFFNSKNIQFTSKKVG